MAPEKLVEAIAEDIVAGKLAPWKAENAALGAGTAPPRQMWIAAAARRAAIERKSGAKFRHLVLPDEPYCIEYRCPEDDTFWTLAADDEQTHCGVCGAPLRHAGDDGPTYRPLVNSYIGGAEDYYSYAGEVTVAGDVERTFQNILCYGTGVGHLGISVGCFQLNKYGPIEVQVASWAGAARNLAFVFDTDEERERAKGLIREHLPEIIEHITREFLDEYQGEVYDVDFAFKQHHRDRILHCCFFTRFSLYRGHTATSRAVGEAKNRIDALFAREGVKCRVSVIGMGRDGDLKPSPRNRRGRYASAQQRIPIREYEKNIGRPIDHFLSYIELDRQGVLEELGWPAYTGMGGEIIPAFYRTMKNNPRPYLVSCYQKVYAEIRGDDLVFGVELPNLEIGVVSGPEGIVPPSAREAMWIAGIRDARDYAAHLAAVTLGGEFNFATLHIKEKLYTGR